MLQIKKRSLALILAATLLTGGILSAGGLLLYQTAGGDYVRVAEKDYQRLTYMTEKYDKLEQLEQVIDTNYYKEVPDEDLELGIYKGLFWGLGDMYSNYLTAEEYENLSIYTQGEFQGIGVTISADASGNIEVVSTIDDSPAQKAGLRTGDLITKVDGKAYTGAEMDMAASAMRGKPGTHVKVTYYRDGVSKEVNITRANIVKISVTGEILPDNIGYIRISQFENNTDEDFKKELRNMELKGVSGIVIDLRNNGGGIVESGTEIADMLLGEGVITYLEDKEGKKTYYKSDENLTAVPYALLVNEGTASTSEIVTAAVKDAKQGVVVGAKTFGKGVVQSITPLKGGDAIKLTVMQYFSPKGNVINGNGIEPDYAVKLVEGDDRDYQLEKAVALLKK